MEEKMEEKPVNNGDGEQKLKFQYYITMGMNDTGEFALQTNVPNLVLGYGMLEFAKRGVENHINSLKSKNIIVPPKHGIIDFIRGKQR